jgi:hypothetical protein
METKNQSAMRQLLNQLREERNTLPMDAEWNRCFQAIESVIESKYIQIEKEQIIDAFEQGENNSVDYFVPELRIKESEQYYNETYG